MYDWEENTFVPLEGNELGLTETYTCKYLCDLVELRGAKSLMVYGKDFYAGYSALTVNEYGKGRAWYVSADADKDFFADFLEKILETNQISCGVKGDIPDALEITVRESEEAKYYLYQNFGTEAVKLPAPEEDAVWLYGSRRSPAGCLRTGSGKSDEIKNKHPYQTRRQDLYCDSSHDISLFLSQLRRFSHTFGLNSKDFL